MVHHLNSKQHKNYKTIPLETLQDTRLSQGARSLLFFLMAQDKYYKVVYPHICESLGVSYRTALRYMNELIEYRYVDRECEAITRMGTDGHFKWTFHVWSRPKPEFTRDLDAYADKEYQRKLRAREAKVSDLGTVRRELWGSS